MESIFVLRRTSRDFTPALSRVRVIIQKVAKACVTVAGETPAEIDRGICVFLGIGRADGEPDAAALADKIRRLRIFEDEHGKMNRSLMDVHGNVLVVSQFTLYADCTRGNRPSFSDAAPPAEARALYDFFIRKLRESGLTIATGRFQAKMQVSLVNDGPVTFFLET